MQILTFLLGMLLPLSVVAKDVVLGISPFQPITVAEQRFTDIVTFYTQVELGDTLIVINSADSRAIATLSVPQNKAYASPKARVKYARDELIKIKAFTDRFSQGSRTLGGMDAPSVINRIAVNYPHVTDIFLVGSALYDEPHQNINMATSLRIPSDAFLASSPIESPFGIAGRENVLQGKRIHWAITNVSQDSMHAEALKRFWFLHIVGQSGKLVSFAHDFQTVSQRLISGAHGLSLPYTINSNGKFEMQGIRRFVPETSTPPQVSVTQDNTEEKNTSVNSEAITVAIEWEGHGVDLDVYGKVGDAKPLYYKHSSNEYGQHFKDILSGSAQAPLKRFETIEFHKGIDPERLVLGVNVYKSPRRDTPIQGALRLTINKKTYTKAFQFDVESGNHGKDMAAVLASGVSSEYSQYFTVQDIVGTSANAVAL